MSTQVLLNLFNELRKIDKMRGQAFYLFFATNLMYSFIHLYEW